MCGQFSNSRFYANKEEVKMKKKTFYIILFSVLAVCIALTAALIIYTVKQYEYVSIIRFIARERW